MTTTTLTPVTYTETYTVGRKANKRVFSVQKIDWAATYAQQPNAEYWHTRALFLAGQLREKLGDDGYEAAIDQQPEEAFCDWMTICKTLEAIQKADA